MGKIEQEDILENWGHASLENKDLFEFTNGLWKGKKPPYIYVKVLRNTNFNNDGTLALDDIAEFEVEKKQFQKRKLYPGDIILERSGGGPKQPVGRVVFFDTETGDYSFSNFTTRIRIKDKQTIKPKFLLYYLLHFYNRGNTYELQQRTTGIRNLNFSEYKKTNIPLLELSEQQKIVSVLFKLQQAIEQQERIIVKTTELKLSLMHRLFTYGLRGEELKETEIGKMPKGWKLTSIGQAYEFTTKPRGLDLSKHKEIPFIPMEIISENQRLLNKYEMRKKFSSGTYVQKGDLVVAKITPSFENGKQGIVTDIPLAFCYATTEVWPLHGVNGHSNIEYLHYYLKKPGVRNEIAGKMEGSTGRQRVPKNVIAETKIPLPPYKEQVEISDIFISLDQKVDVIESKKENLQVLFKSMLQLLMTGQVRVKDIDFEGVARE